MNEFRADIHCHSHYSDGTASPKELVALAKQKNLAGLSITDHDSIAAYPEAIPAAKEVGLGLISGVEFSTYHQGNSVHILAYSFSLQNEELISFCQKHYKRRQERNSAMLERINALGMPLTEQEVYDCSSTFADGKGTIGRPHIALAMLKKGYIPDIQTAFKNFIGEGKPCYVERQTFGIEETLEVIHKAKGFAVIAHPHFISDRKLIGKLLEMNFDGIECYYCNVYAHQCIYWAEVAKKKKWLITGGSDYHGSIKPDIELGCSWIGQDTFQFLESKYLEANQEKTTIS